MHINKKKKKKQIDLILVFFSGKTVDNLASSYQVFHYEYS